MLHDNPIREHDHSLDVREVRDAPSLGGRTVVEDCRDNSCGFWRARWEDTTTLDDFSGGGSA